MRPLAQLVLRIADAARQAAHARPGPLVVQGVRVRYVEVGAADMLMVVLAIVIVPRLKGQVQAHLVLVGEPVEVAVRVRRYLEAERRVVRQGAPQVTHGKDRTKASQPGRGCGTFIRERSVHEPSISQPTDSAGPARAEAAGDTRSFPLSRYALILFLTTAYSVRSWIAEPDGADDAGSRAPGSAGRAAWSSPGLSRRRGPPARWSRCSRPGSPARRGARRPPRRPAPRPPRPRA